MLDALLICLLVAMAAALRPWRAVGPDGPPWPWLACWAVMPLLWGLDRHVGIALVQPLSAASLLMLLAGWPLAVLAMVPAALLTGWLAGLDGVETLHRLLWLGCLPATLAMLLGSAVRRWLPHHLFVYILGRGFFCTLLAMAAAGLLRSTVDGVPADMQRGELLVGRWLAAWADAIVTGMVVAMFVAFRPQWLATYSDRLYLPRR